MDVVGVAEVVSAVAVSETRLHHRRKSRESALALLNSYQTPEFAVAITLLMTTWESLGILTSRRKSAWI